MLSLSLIILIVILLFLILAKAYLSSLVTAGLLLLILVSVTIGLLPKPILNHLQNFPYKQPQLFFKQNNVIVLLGGGVADVSKTILLPSLLTYSRLTAAAETYFACKKAQKKCTIITSGGDLRQAGKSEAHVYKAELLKLGVASEDIQSEFKSLTTYQNAKFSAQIIKQNHYDQVFLVTSGIHMKRAELSFAHFGISVVPIASDYVQTKKSIFALGYNLAIADAAFHEYLGIIKYQSFDFDDH